MTLKDDDLEQFIDQTSDRAWVIEMLLIFSRHRPSEGVPLLGQADVQMRRARAQVPLHEGSVNKWLIRNIYKSSKEALVLENFNWIWLVKQDDSRNCKIQ